MRKFASTMFCAVAMAASLVAVAQERLPAGSGERPATAAPQTARQEAAKGDQQRHYFFEAAGKEMPYRLYVPRSYDPRVGAPLIVALHGYGGNQDYFFEAVKDLPALCEQYGVIFVAPMGLATDGWYGAPLSIPGAAPRSGGGATPTRAAPRSRRRSTAR